MSVSIVRGTNNKPASSQELVQSFARHPDWSGELFIGFPIISTPEGKKPIDALWISPDKGLVVFDLVEGTEPGPYQDRQDDLANKLESRLRTHRELMRRRKLIVPIQTISFAPGAHRLSPSGADEYLLAGCDSLAEQILRLEEGHDGFDENVYKKALSALQNISTLRRSRRTRSATKGESRGAKLERLEASIATLDRQQSRAVIETVDGVQRIRGLAGSGKTIVLALKAAYLHAQHPDWRIAVTFSTRSLKGQFRQLINGFCLQQAGEQPDWSNLRVLNAWGAPGGEARDGIYYEFCRIHEVRYFDFMTAKEVFGGGLVRGIEFSEACRRALAQASSNSPAYDAILVDEAQDLPPEFLRLCYQLLDSPKRLVYAYDELQNLTGESLPPPEDIFGRRADGSPEAMLDTDADGVGQRDVILDICYRNSRPLLTTAHALGFGIYREPEKPGESGLVQMFDYPQLWEEIGYRIVDGELRNGAPVTLQRTDETSPGFLEDHSDIEDLIQFIPFDSEEQQNQWLVGEIRKNLEEDELRHDDIIVINPDPRTTRKKVGPIRQQLLEAGIDCHLAGVDNDPDLFFESDSSSVTFTGIYRAKGNEAGMVYVINAHECQSARWNLARIRNRLFTAITRSKAWVRVIGVGDRMVKLQEEFERLRLSEFKLEFSYPTDEERQRLRVIHRDITQGAARGIGGQGQGFDGSGPGSRIREHPQGGSG